MTPLPGLFIALAFAAGADMPLEVLPGTAPLTMQGDLAEQMVAGIGAYLDRALVESAEKRAGHWNRDFSSRAAYEASVEPNRKRLATILGAADPRVPIRLERYALGQTSGPSYRIESSEGLGPAVANVRWSVLRGIEGEGLLLEPLRDEWRADVIFVPDCDAAPESALPAQSVSADLVPPALALAQSGCRVIIPLLMNRADTHSGNPSLRMTNQPHREFIYRAAYQMGRHIIGYEVQKILAAIDWMRSEPVLGNQGPRPVGVMGYGEGGLLALYAAALDRRIDAAAVSGYFGPRESLWREPIYRNVWGLLAEFGDAEIASLIAPRALIVEASGHPYVSGPPAPRNGRSGAAPGAIETPDAAEVRREFERAKALVGGLNPAPVFKWIQPEGGQFGAPETLRVFLTALDSAAELTPRDSTITDVRGEFDSVEREAEARFKRQFDQLVADTQWLMHHAEFRRKEFWKNADLTSADAWNESVKWYRDYFNEEVIGALPAIELPPNARSRLVYDEPAFRGYEVVMDVFPDVFAYGILLLPKNLNEGERRPVVVCQHGLEGRPQDVADPTVDSPYYHRFACKLVERGFITFSPQNPYIGEDRFRVLQRKANPLKRSLFSFITRQHEQIIRWLKTQPTVDPERIAFYGLSYGGKTAMRVPALLDGYCLSICSGDYNEWIWKNVSVSHPLSYMFTGEYEMFEFDLGDAFNHAEMSWLIFPRPFMVERGHHDGVAYDEWVAYEFAKTRRHYVMMGQADKTEIEYFNGPHSIHGVGTFAFLEKHLNGRVK